VYDPEGGYEHPPSGPRIGPALVAAMVAVAAAAGSLGYYGARRILADRESASGNPALSTPATVPTSPDGGDEPTTPGTDPPDPGPDDPTSGPPEQPTSDECPALTVLAVRAQGLPSQLKLIIYIEAERAGSSNAEVWICASEAGTLFYQGHVKNGPFTAATSNNTLLLGEGIQGTVEVEGAGWVATNVVGDRTTEYHVSVEKLVQRNLPGESVTEYTVINKNVP
jgi:hypothetical protein